MIGGVADSELALKAVKQVSIASRLLDLLSHVIESESNHICFLFIIINFGGRSL